MNSLAFKCSLVLFAALSQSACSEGNVSLEEKVADLQLFNCEFNLDVALPVSEELWLEKLRENEITFSCQGDCEAVNLTHDPGFREPRRPFKERYEDGSVDRSYTFVGKPDDLAQRHIVFFAYAMNGDIFAIERRVSQMK